MHHKIAQMRQGAETTTRQSCGIWRQSRKSTISRAKRADGSSRCLHQIQRTTCSGDFQGAGLLHGLGREFCQPGQTSNRKQCASCQHWKGDTEFVTPYGKGKAAIICRQCHDEFPLCSVCGLSEPDVTFSGSGAVARKQGQIKCSMCQMPSCPRGHAACGDISCRRILPESAFTLCPRSYVGKPRGRCNDCWIRQQKHNIEVDKVCKTGLR